MQQTCIFMTTWGRNVLISETPKKTSFLFFFRLNIVIRDFSIFHHISHALYIVSHNQQGDHEFDPLKQVSDSSLVNKKT